ncbi:amidase [Promicromonospora thailandica]|uniref:Amidase n=1 Tax=Promicromonospora thailandica TaxID=765201 RepID=A0A9X2G122_9MICO|nr:amidase [Promicromonospora thailandica]MCP2263428.1 amidase [Promicromonospora thailandica]
MDALHERTAVELRDLLAAGELRPTEVTDYFLDRVERLGPLVGAFATVTPDRARERAAALEAAGPAPAGLWGLPTGDKDLWNRAGVPTGFGSRAFAGAPPAEQSDEIVQVLDAAGVVSLGKTAAPELGFPAYTEPLGAPPARTPWDLTRGAGGSSGGAAAAVAAGLLPFAPGSDGGGSIRIPAAACGVVGLKPTRGLLPAGSGVDALGGLVVNGPIARTVADTALLLEAMLPRSAGGGVAHPFTLRAPSAPAGAYLAAAQRGALPAPEDGGPGPVARIGVTTSSAWDGFYDIRVSPEARAALDAGVRALAGAGHEVEETVLAESPEYAPAFRTLWMGGASAVPLDDPETIDRLEPLTRWLIRSGRELPARQLAEALRTLSAYERSLVAQVGAYDAVVTPALALTPRPVGWYDAEDPERNFEQQCLYTPFTSMLNVAGLPAITVPTHWTEPTADAPAGLPMGVQIIGRPGGERTLLALAAAMEAALPRPTPFPL